MRDDWTKPGMARYAGQCGRRLCAMALGGLVAAACAVQPGLLPAVQGKRLAEPQAEAALLARIRSEVGVPACTSDAQCRTLPIGEKACGGPAGWLPWSSATAAADRLQPLAEQLAAMQRRRHEHSGLASDCRFLADPGATCRAQRCTLRSGEVGPDRR